MQERLQKALARAGVASRRDVEQMMRDGRIRLNGKVAIELGTKIDWEKDRVQVDNQHVSVLDPEVQDKFYFLLNKPAGVLSTTRDDRGRKTVMDFVTCAHEGRVYPVGRLDYDAEGALLLTNDGELANRLIHPRYKVKKTYMVKVKGVPPEDKIAKLRRGVYLEDGPTGPSEITVVSKARVNTWVQVVLTQGKNRQIKRMFWRIGHPVMKLIRTHFAGISVDRIPIGKFRELTKKEIMDL